MQYVFSRWDYSGEEPSPPQYSLYTLLSLKQTFLASAVLLAVHLLVLVFAKLLTSTEFKGRGDYTNKILHIIENSNYATPYVDWDEGEHSTEEYRMRFLATVKEMALTLTINAISSVVMVVPLWYTGDLKTKTFTNLIHSVKHFSPSN